MQCILTTSNALTMAVRALGIVLLFSFVAALSGLPTTTTDPIANTYEEHTLATELKPPPLEEKEHHATVYIINLYAVKNSSGTTSEEMFENEVIEAVPDILEPLATVFLVVEDDDEEKEKDSPVDLDEFAEGLESEGFKVDKIDLTSKTKVLKMKLEKAKAQNMMEAALKSGEERIVQKDRKKRTICLKCGGGGGYGGGYGGGGYPSGGGGCSTCGYPSSGGYQTAVIPVVVVPISGHRGGGGGHRGGGGGYYPPSGGGGCNTCGGGGGGGGGSYSQASASAQSSSGSWGKK